MKRLAAMGLERERIADWIRFKYKHDMHSLAIMENAVRYGHDPETIVQAIVAQVAADADHSDLLWRLCRGEELKSPEDYQAYRDNIIKRVRTQP